MTLAAPVAKPLAGSLDAAQIVQDASWLPHTFNATGDQLSFLRVPAERRRSEPFLSAERLGGCRQHALSASAVRQAMDGQSSVPIHFVFHTAFCGSTLLAEALEAGGAAAALKEPAILLNLHHRFSRCANASEHDRLDLILKLLSRPFHGSKTVVVKPSCFVNPLIPFIMRDAPDAKAVLLHSDLRTFLFAVAKRGIAGRSWARQAFASSLNNIPTELGFASEDLLSQTDLQVAGLAWLMRRAFFDRVSAEFGAARMLQVQSEGLYQEPADTLENVGWFLQLPDPQTIYPIAATTDVFRTHSKDGRAFGPDDRVKELESLRATHGDEVEPVARWVESLARERGIKLSAT